MKTKKKDQKALYTIFQAIEELVFGKISCVNTTDQAWDILQKSYKGDNWVRQVWLQTLHDDSESPHMNDLEIISTYFDQV